MYILLVLLVILIDYMLLIANACFSFVDSPNLIIDHVHSMTSVSVEHTYRQPLEVGCLRSHADAIQLALLFFLFHGFLIFSLFSGGTYNFLLLLLFRLILIILLFNLFSFCAPSSILFFFFIFMLSFIQSFLYLLHHKPHYNLHIEILYLIFVLIFFKLFAF